MIKKIIIVTMLCMMSSCSFAEGTRSLVVGEKNVYKKQSIDSQIVGLLQSLTIVQVEKEVESISDNNEVVLWYKIKKNDLTGWISDYNLIKFPCNGLTAVTMNPNKWIIYQDSTLSEELSKYKPNEIISITDAIETENGIIYNILHNNNSGWVHESQINIEDRYYERLRALYNFNSFNTEFYSLDKIVSTLLDQKEYSISTKNDLIKYKISFNDNIIDVLSSGNKYWVQQITILDDFEFPYNIRNGMKINYAISMLGSNFSNNNGVFEYMYSENVFGNPAYSISFHTVNGYIEKIIVSYYLFD